mgnify:CR=1
KNFGANTNILIIIFLFVEFIRKKFSFTKPQLKAVKTGFSAGMKIKGSKFYGEFLNIFARLKIKNFDNKY